MLFKRWELICDVVQLLLSSVMTCEDAVDGILEALEMNMGTGRYLTLMNEECAPMQKTLEGGADSGLD